MCGTVLADGPCACCASQCDHRGATFYLAFGVYLLAASYKMYKQAMPCVLEFGVRLLQCVSCIWRPECDGTGCKGGRTLRRVGGHGSAKHVLDSNVFNTVAKEKLPKKSRNIFVLRCPPRGSPCAHPWGVLQTLYLRAFEQGPTTSNCGLFLYSMQGGHVYTQDVLPSRFESTGRQEKHDARLHRPTPIM